MALTPLVKKMVTCLVAGAVFSALLLVLGNSGTLRWAPPAVVFSLVALSLLAALALPFVWQAAEKKGKAGPVLSYGFLYSFIRYCLAFNLAGFGWKKLVGLQFIVPAKIAALPMNQQSGEWLTWYYFGHSPAFGSIIAAIQIIGSCLLLFQRTVLMGAVVLFSLLLHLALINIFYGMNAGALLQSLVLTTGVLFLLLSDYQRLVQFFLQARSNLPGFALKNALLKNLLRLSAIVLSLLFCVYLKLRVR